MSGIKHQHRCLVCFEKWYCLQNCDLSRGHHVEECTSCYASRTKRSEELKHELDRFAAFIEAIRDLLRWIDVANKLELGAVVLRSNVEQVLDRRGCDCVCEVDYELCMSHEIRSELSRSFDVEMVLCKEGELLAKGATL